MYFARFARLVALISTTFAVMPANAQSLTCQTLAVPAQVRSEGLTEQVGDILLNCTGGAPSATVTGSLVVQLPVSITNRLTTGNVVDALLTVDTGAGPVSAGATAVLAGPNAVAFANMSFTVSPAGTATLRISRIRAAVAELGVTNTTPIQATLSSSRGNTDILFTSVRPTVAVPHVGLLAGSVSTLLNCTGSKLPDTLDVASLFAARTAVAAARVTEGISPAFEPVHAGLDTGVRFVLRYSGFPEGARLFMPDAIAGSDATQPTATGLIGGTAAGGAYTPGSKSLLLVRIVNTDENGAGGRPAYTPGAPGSGAQALNSVGEVELTGGSGMVVYEVADANPLATESAEIPTWMGLAPTGGKTASPRQSITWGPVSDVTVAAATDPIPRFLAVEPPEDCSAQGDCSMFPQMSITAPDLKFTGVSGGKTLSQWIHIKNTGGGYLTFNATAAYTSGSGWMKLHVERGYGKGGAVLVYAMPKSVAPGTYEGTVTIDAGDVGVQTLPVTLTVTAPPPDPNAPQMNALVNAATFGTGVVPGSLASLWGVRLKGTNVSVTFDGVPARLLYEGENQINLEVPAALAGRTSSEVKVTVDGLSCQSRTVELSAMSPGIFTRGILNQDNTVNEAGNGAAGDTVIQIFATGLPAADVGTITGKIHDVWVTSPDYAGPAPGLSGVQQVNLRVPKGWPAMNTSVILCATSIATGTRTCSPEAPLVVK